jgi:hypothetical protein
LARPNRYPSRYPAPKALLPISANHMKSWCRLRGLNSRPSVYKAAALGHKYIEIIEVLFS